jgi:hypothetical protein
MTIIEIEGVGLDGLVPTLSLVEEMKSTPTDILRQL